jgi:hypothetical protein
VLKNLAWQRVNFSYAVFSLFDCLAVLGLVQSDLVGHFICEFKCKVQQKTLSCIKVNMVCNIIQIRYMQIPGPGCH